MPNLFHRIGDAAERLAARIGACARDITIHLEFHWAEFRGDSIRALTIMKEITVADLSKLTAAVDRVIAKSAADAAALAEALAANASQQDDVDTLTGKLDAIAPEPIEQPPVEPVVDVPAEPQLNPVVDQPVQ